jgi:transcriptional regulator with XRE-family HTH domain
MKLENITEHEPQESPTIEEIASSLRKIRKSKGWTLKEVEEASGGRWKAVVIGSYERCDRALSLNKAISLANFYNVPLDELLGLHSRDTSKGDRITLDIRRVRESRENSLKPLQGFVQTICSSRRDWNGEILSIRDSDALALAALLAIPPAQIHLGLSAFNLLFSKADA